MALIATCTHADQQTIMTNLSMEEAALIQHSGDRPNVFFVVREMPGDYSQWQETLDDDIEITKTLGISSERKVIFCRSIETACRLYEYYEEHLSECAYYDPQGSHRIVLLQCTIPSLPHLSRPQLVDHCWILVE